MGNRLIVKQLLYKNPMDRYTKISTRYMGLPTPSRTAGIILCCLLLCGGLNALAQQDKSLPSVALRGKLTFERKTNVHKQMDEMLKGGMGNPAMIENIKKQVPKYKTDVFELFFDEKQSLYKPAPDGISESKMMMGNLPAERNIVFHDYNNMRGVAEKRIFEKTYLIADSLPVYQWKITEEFRKIAGFNCRRAETIMMDSIYVIAFYTDAILAPGGPEGFNGLPGMILGIVMPRLNLTYFATNYENFLADEKILKAPEKGEAVNTRSLDERLRSSMKNWGNFIQRILWYIGI